MKLYEVIVRDGLYSEPKTLLVLSSQPLSVGHPDLPALCNLHKEEAGYDSDWDERVTEVRPARIRVYATDEQEASDMFGVLSQLGL
jgi:hypothetical protein